MPKTKVEQFFSSAEHGNSQRYAWPSWKKMYVRDREKIPEIMKINKIKVLQKVCIAFCTPTSSFEDSNESRVQISTLQMMCSVTEIMKFAYDRLDDPHKSNLLLQPFDPSFQRQRVQCLNLRLTSSQPWLHCSLQFLCLGGLQIATADVCSDTK